MKRRGKSLLYLTLSIGGGFLVPNAMSFELRNVQQGHVSDNSGTLVYCFWKILHKLVRTLKNVFNTWVLVRSIMCKFSTGL